jgi:hypothetical protein
MKKMLLVLGLLASQSVLAEDLTLGAVNFVKKGNEPNNFFSPCKKTQCNVALNTSQEYLPSIKASNGAIIRDKRINQINIDVNLLNKNQESVLEINYKEKTTVGYVNEKDELDTSVNKSRKGEENNYEKLFHVSITNDKTYTVKVDDDRNIIVILR